VRSGGNSGLRVVFEHFSARESLAFQYTALETQKPTPAARIIVGACRAASPHKALGERPGWVSNSQKRAVAQGAIFAKGWEIGPPANWHGKCSSAAVPSLQRRAIAPRA